MSLSPFYRVAALVALVSACSSHDAGVQETSSEAPSGEPGRAAPALSVDDSGRIRFLAKTEGPSAPTNVTLPARADGMAELVDRASGLRVAFAAEGGHAEPARIAERTVVYRGGGPAGADVLHRPSAVGTEDFVTFSTRPALEEARYRVDVSSVAGLRLVEDVLEFLDTNGTPRLRMAAPYVLGRRGERHDARVTIDDCAVDRNPAGPWGRPVTPPGRPECTVRVAWNQPTTDASARIEYPAVLDPAWTATKGLMTAKRSQHTATLLANGKVLIAGGKAPGIARIGSAELYDPTTDTFAATGALVQPRTAHVAVRLKSGDVLLVAGDVGAQSAELYEVAKAKFRAVGSLTAARLSMEGTLLGNDKVLVAGGQDAAAAFLDTAETYDPTTERWVATGRMSSKRAFFSLTTLDGGSVLAAGGVSSAIGETSSSELFDFATGKWTSSGGLSDARAVIDGASLSDGRVLIAGGDAESTNTVLASSEIYDPKTTKFGKAGPLAHARFHHTLTALANGAVVAAGGVAVTSKGTALKSAELYDPDADTWSALPDLTAPRTDHTGTLLDDGRVLLTGGDSTADTLQSAELLALDADGKACASASTCASGFCADGLCCAEACTASCNACSKAVTGKADGTCAPVLAGKDPRGDCKDDGAPLCKSDGFCDGKAGCEKYASTSCKPNPCAKDGDCTSGACADGVCCDTACDGKCEACTAAKKGSGDDGTCGPVAKATDPDGDCGTLGAGVCRADATCDGKAACIVPTAGKTCAAATCSDATTLAAIAKCGNTGDCTPDETDCSPYLCDAKAVACTTKCAKDTDCSPGAQCKSAKCEKSPNGAACKASIECTSGSCADGVCCDTACDGQCEACDLTGTEGQCGAVTGAPHGSRAACDGTDACAGTCNGLLRTGCDYPDKATTCGDTTACENASESGDRCNGRGLCVLTPTQVCSPFACGADACLTKCKKDVDCAPGFSCSDDGRCQSPTQVSCTNESTLGLPDGGATACSPYRCVSDACTTSCTKDAECASGAKCSDSRCTSPDDGGCGCRIASKDSRRSPRGSSNGSVLTLLVGLLLARRMRRKPAR